jgi:hypothetical protein
MLIIPWIAQQIFLPQYSHTKTAHITLPNFAQLTKKNSPLCRVKILDLILNEMVCVVTLRQGVGFGEPSRGLCDV